MNRDSDTITALWLLAAIAVVAYRRHIAYWLGIGLVMLLLTALLLGSQHS
ncbi:hypothetical protein [Catenulispora rubra]|nr:hypothetical protein [Catenulispora rubra]